jgi:hypothetical protein
MHSSLTIRGPSDGIAGQLLRCRLSALGMTAGDAAGDGVPLSLKVDRSAGLRPGEFALEWSPQIDPHEIYDDNFTWHGADEASATGVRASGEARVGGRIVAGDSAGAIYGALEFIERCEVRRSLPVRPLDVRRSPTLALRSACLQLMKRGQYILPITRQEFGWFFDRTWWTRYLDFIVAHRFNAITLWNFHPFPFFCRIDGHPEVCELPEDEREANASHLRWLITQAGARGITLLWHFYNIYVCPSYAKAHGLNTLYNQFTPQQEKSVFEYIRNSVRSFATAFPEVEFVACAGEGVPAGKAERFVADVLVAALNETSHHPRLVVRQWSSLTAQHFERDVVGKYDALWAMIKHNAEHIAGTVPDSRVSDWVATGVPTIVNFHMLSEIGPFRWSPPQYVREICLHYKALGVQGVHVYPHWPWRTPRVGDLDFKGDEIDRDWLYHEAWGRYSYDAVRDRDEEERHWTRRATQRGLSPEAASAIVKAYEASGAALPRLQQNLWVHYDNHSVLPAGLTLGQLRFARSMHGRNIVRTDRLEALSPLRGELQDWQPPAGGFSFDSAAAQSLDELNRALALLERLTSNADAEPARLRADLRSMRFAVTYLRQKATVAGLLMQFHRDGEPARLREALARLRDSIDVYRAYRDHAEQCYEGISDVPPYMPFFNYKSAALPYTWTDCLEIFERELANLEVFAASVEDDQPWSLVHHFGFDRVDDRREVERTLIHSGGRWLTGDPDFLPWAGHLDRMQTLVLLPSASYALPDISVLSDPAIVRRWIARGGQLVAITLPDRSWSQAKVLAQILGIDPAMLDPRTDVIDGQRLLTIRAGESWSWQRRSRDRGIRGSVTLGEGAIEFIALTSPSQMPGNGFVRGRPKLPADVAGESK